MTSEPQVRATLPRQADLAALFTAVRDMRCTSVVGVSNLGKTALLHALTDPQVQARYLGQDASNYRFIYIDFNQMLEMTEQAFYELVLRCSLDALREPGYQPHEDVLQKVDIAYASLVAPASNFEVPLRFAQAMAAIGDLLPQRVVFLLDEVDGPMEGIDGRVFLNLRALKDKHRQGLSYITATNRRLGQLRQDGDVAEFHELFDHHTLYISLLTEAEITDFVATFCGRRRCDVQPRRPGFCAKLGWRTPWFARDNLLHPRSAHRSACARPFSGLDYSPSSQ